MKKILKRLTSFGLAATMCLGLTTVVHVASAENIVADAATDYYAPVTATGGAELLGQVHDLITSTHKTYTSYANCSDPDYVIKSDPGSNSSSVMEFYSQADIGSSWGSGGQGTWNREHVWCKSLSEGLWTSVSNTTTNGGADLHHIRPVESGLNSARGNNPYGVVTNGKATYYEDSNNQPVALGGYIAGGYFEPIDEVKGDVARIVMYVYTHYNTYTNAIFGGYAKTNGTASSSFFGTLHYTSIMAPSDENDAIQLLLDWNEADPVDDIELARNDAVYAIQGNRNPFIDHPEYADAIWGDGSASNPSNPAVTITGLTVNATAVTLNVGGTYDLKATPVPSNASANVTWTSSDTSVATVSTSGQVTAKSKGTATITATSKSDSTITVQTTVTVLEKAASGYAKATITLASFPNIGASYGLYNWEADGISGNAYVYKGSGFMQFNTTKTSYFVASNTPTDGAIKSVTVTANSSFSNYTWKLLTSTQPYNVTSNPTSGTDRGEQQVSTTGTTWTVDGNDTYFALVLGNKNAAALDSIEIEYGEDTSETPELEGIAINPSAFNLDIGGETTLSVLPIPSNVTTEVTWTSSDTSVAQVAADGTVTAIGAGTATITAVSKDNSTIKATATVTVAAAGEPGTPTPPVDPVIKLESITLSPSTLSLDQGNSSKLTVTCVPANANGEVSWASSDTSVALVAADGTVTAVGAGTATITATSRENSSITASVSVTVTAISGTVDTTKIDAFHTAVEGILSDVALDEILASVNNAIRVYGTLSAVDRAAAAFDVAALQEAIAEYNEIVHLYNAAAAGSASTALNGIGSFLKR